MSPPHPRKLLVRGVNWLGDAVMTTPALIRLREALPQTHITLLTRAKLADLWKSHAAIDDIIPMDPEASVWSVGGNLRAGEFDAALVLPNSPRSALEVWCARIPRRIGYARPWRNWFLTEAIPIRAGHVRMRKPSVGDIRRIVRDADADGASDRIRRRALPWEAHQMHDYLHLATALGASAEPLPPTLAVDASEIEAARSSYSISDTVTWIGLNAGAEYGPAKRWPRERFVAATREIQQRSGCGVIVLGGPGDTALAGELAAQISEGQLPVLNLAGRTSLRELMALLTQCHVLLTNDTGPMHVAAALGAPVVVPFGSTSPELTGPGLPGDPRHRLIRSDAACSPCFLRECPIDFRCMRGIGVEPVVRAAMDVLSKTLPDT